MHSSSKRGIRHIFNRIRRTHPALKHVSIVTIFLLLLWLYTLQQGERATFASKIDACEWPRSPQWPDDRPIHKVVLIADPQLVDAHTYPGRPWPLSALTEIFTDRYMARNYRLINEKLDPDSIIFLGDMFDGGREWAPSKSRPLTAVQKWAMEVTSPATSDVPKEMSEVNIVDPGWKRQHVKTTTDELKSAVSLKATDLTSFEHGEGGRWKPYGNTYWEKEYNRFGKIFLAKDQLYPVQPREIEPIPQRVYPTGSQELELAVQRAQNAINFDNGARKVPKDSYLVNGRTRNVLSSLPGNHDLGFGSGVQLSVRARYKWHFGEMNRVDVLGNFTFVSIDALSLAAWSQFEEGGAETPTAVAQDRVQIYAGAQRFLDELPATVQQATAKNLDHFFPMYQQSKQWKHRSVDADRIAENETSTKPHRSSQSKLPVILLSHVPLHRQADTPCGPQRERGNALSLSGGYQYQNVLTKTLTDTIMSKVSRVGALTEIFSGDDHDYCDITHASADRAVREETVKSFSWAMGVRKPGFLMVSLWNPLEAEGRSMSGGIVVPTRQCLLPDQLGIFIRYGTLAGLPLVVLLLRAIVLALRAKEEVEEEPVLQFSKLLSSGLTKVKQLTRSYKPVSKHRHRASSSALKPPSNMNLSVQRSTNARARSVSPGVGFGTASPFQTPPSIEQVGSYLTPRHSSNPGSDDEESRIGDMDYLEDDTQAKWRRRQRPKGKLRRALDEFIGSLLFVGSIASCYYIVLIRTG